MRKNLSVFDSAPLLEAYGAWNEDARGALRFFLSTMAPMLRSLDDKIRCGDWGEAVKLSHAAKGAANFTGAFRLGELLDAIHRAANACDGKTLGILGASLAPCFAELREALAQALESDDDPR